MKVLLDEHLPHPLRPSLRSHDVYTVAWLNWKGVTNGDLLALAASNGFDVILTMDRSIEHQHNLATLPLAVIILSAPSNRVVHLEPLMPEVLRVLETLKPKTITHVPAVRSSS